ncbi:MAG: hypothetical protein JW746_06790 [Candidatus Krumholzibacteriota bacterium]|nr:hypothetical protein [Candidatus Krumholzibacteriota bacterium]
MKIRGSILVILILSLGVLSIPGRSSSEGTAAIAGNEEYEVVSALVEFYYGSDLDLILIAEKTEPWCVVIHLSELKEKWKKLKNVTFDSLIERNKGYTLLERKFKFKTEYRLISKEDYISLLGDSLSPDWDNFDKIYPETSGVLIISRVGIDPEGSQALIYFCNAYRCSDDKVVPKNRSIAFLIRENDKWKLEGIEKGFRAFSAY